MCIAVIKKSNLKRYGYIVAFNRDEEKNRTWKNIGYH